MATIVTRTLAGGIAENNALNGVTPLSPIKDIVFTDEAILTAQADIETASLPASIIFTVPKTDIVFDSTGSGVSSTLHIPISTNKTGHIRAFVVRLEDDTIWGYAPYRPADDGLNKGNDIALTLLAIITVSNSALTINYQPLDTQAIVDGMIPDLDLNYVRHNEALTTITPTNVFIEKSGSKRQGFNKFVDHVFAQLKNLTNFTYLGTDHTTDNSFTKFGLRFGSAKHTNFDGITYDDTPNEFEFYGDGTSALKVNTNDGIKLTKGFNGNNKRLSNIADATANKDALNRQTGDARYASKNHITVGSKYRQTPVLSSDVNSSDLFPVINVAGKKFISFTVRAYIHNEINPDTNFFRCKLGFDSNISGVVSDAIFSTFVDSSDRLLIFRVDKEIPANTTDLRIYIEHGRYDGSSNWQSSTFIVMGSAMTQVSYMLFK